MSLPASFLQAMMQMSIDIHKLTLRLAPDNPTMSIIHAQKQLHTQGVLIQTVQVSGPFNVIINNLQQGTVDVHFGSSTSGPPDLVLQPTDNPILIPLGMRTDKAVSFIVNSNSPTAAQGTIFLELY